MKRPFKGSSLLTIPNDYIVLDVETTDFDYIYGEIIELHAEKYIDDSLSNTLSILIKPTTPIPEHISSLTGITNDMVSAAPTMDEVIDDIVLFLSDYVLVAHNANFDINFIYDTLLDLRSIHLENNFVDTLRLSRILVNDAENHKLITLANHFSLPESVHRAKGDVLTTALLLDIFKNMLLDNPTLLSKKTVTSKRIDFSKVSHTVDPNKIDANNYFYNKYISITGRMDFLTKSEASQILANLGAINQNGVTNKTDILVLGDLEYQQTRFGDKSSKHKKAESLQQKGSTIEIITEQTFLDYLDI